MSDEFIKVATNEIQEDISELEKTLSMCTSDADVLSHASTFQQHTHKIKGLAPMMGKQELGDVSASLDSIFKIILKKSTIDGVLIILNDIIPTVKFLLNEPDYDAVKLREKISQLEEILN